MWNWKFSTRNLGKLISFNKHNYIKFWHETEWLFVLDGINIITQCSAHNFVSCSDFRVPNYDFKKMENLISFFVWLWKTRWEVSSANCQTMSKRKFSVSGFCGEFQWFLHLTIAEWLLVNRDENILLCMFLELFCFPDFVSKRVCCVSCSFSPKHCQEQSVQHQVSTSCAECA